MCGRAAQTATAVDAAARSFGIHEKRAAAAAAASDNYNMSPGMDATVFTYNRQTNSIELSRKVWGLVTRPGTAAAPLQAGNMSQHFSNLMFNARSDTLYEKPTFSRLARSGQSCIIAVDGFFEWKSVNTKTKQPYFVYRKRQDDDTRRGGKILLLAGLWNRVATGRSDNSSLDTFTILTTEACSELQWLHTRMPVSIDSVESAREWLASPTQGVHQRILALSTPWDWHAVTTDMSSLKYRSKQAMKALNVKTVDSYFSVTPKKKQQVAAEKDGGANVPSRVKRPIHKNDTANIPPRPSATSPRSKKAKKGTLHHFFSPK